MKTYLPIHVCRYAQVKAMPIILIKHAYILLVENQPVQALTMLIEFLKPVCSYALMVLMLMMTPNIVKQPAQDLTFWMRLQGNV